MALPSGYKQLEYIESTGTQYIDTEYYPRWNTRIVDEIKMAAYSGTKAAFGTRNANSATASKAFAVFQTGANTFRVDYFGSSKTITLDVSTDQKLTIDMNKNVCAIGGKTATNTAVTSGEAAYTLMLFTYNNSGKVGGLSSVRRYSTNVYEGDVLVRHYIPCETSGKEVGLWEDVEGVFRGNDGTGTFSAGPEVEGGNEGGGEGDTPSTDGGHNTNIGNTSHEVEGGTVLFGGVIREIDSGTVLVNGVARSILFEKTQLQKFTVTCSGAAKSMKHYAVVDGTLYENALTNGDVVEVEEGTEIYCYVRSDITGDNPIIRRNGSDVGSGTSPKTYTFTVTGDVTIKYTTVTITADTFYKGRIDITM